MSPLLWFVHFLRVIPRFIQHSHELKPLLSCESDAGESGERWEDGIAPGQDLQDYRPNPNVAIPLPPPPPPLLHTQGMPLVSQPTLFAERGRVCHDVYTLTHLSDDGVYNSGCAVNKVMEGASGQEGVSGHAANFVAILAVVLTRHSHREHEGGARVWIYHNLDRLPFFC